MLCHQRVASIVCQLPAKPHSVCNSMLPCWALPVRILVDSTARRSPTILANTRSSGVLSSAAIKQSSAVLLGQRKHPRNKPSCWLVLSERRGGRCGWELRRLGGADEFVSLVSGQRGHACGVRARAGRGPPPAQPQVRSSANHGACSGLWDSTRCWSASKCTIPVLLSCQGHRRSSCFARSRWDPLSARGWEHRTPTCPGHRFHG